MPRTLAGSRRRSTTRRALVAMAIASTLALSACTGGSPGADGTDGPDGGDTGAPAVQHAALTMPASAAAVVDGTTADALGIATSQSLFASAPMAILARADDLTSLPLASAAAVYLGVPLLVLPGATPDGSATPASDETDGAAETSAADATTTAPTPADTPAAGPPAELVAELSRLGVSTVLDVGADIDEAALGGIKVVRAPGTAAALMQMLGATPGVSQVVTSDQLVAAVAALDHAHPAPITVSDAATEQPATPPATGEPEPALPAVAPAQPLAGLAVLATPDVFSVAAVATARAAGATAVVTPTRDPRTSHDAIAALSAAQPTAVLGLGSAFGPAESLAYRVGVAKTGVELPGGGQVVFPGRRMVALYGNPTTAALGVLGEQPVGEAIERAKQMAAPYEPLWSDQPVVPAFELIATVASASPGPDNNYSTEMAVDELRPWVEAARDAGVYVVLDLQPGRTDFLTQAKLYESLLLEPNVGLALDPEWRLKPNQVHLVQIGTVTAAEINTVVEWLADLTRDNNLPQKILMLHQFRLSMISDRDQVDTSRDELSVLIHADGNGPPGSKFNTYAALTANPPPNVWWGWKNFIDEDSPMFTPEETVAVRPEPVFVSYQ